MVDIELSSLLSIYVEEQPAAVRRYTLYRRLVSMVSVYLFHSCGT